MVRGKATNNALIKASQAMDENSFSSFLINKITTDDDSLLVIIDFVASNSDFDMMDVKKV